MKQLGLKTIDTKRINLPGDWKKICADPGVPHLAESIEREGLIHHPRIRWSDKRIVSGRRRIAALIHLGRKKIEVMAVEGTDAEFEREEIAENAIREHDPKRKALLTKKLFDLVEAEVTPEELEASRKDSGSRKPTSKKRLAAKKIAKKLGIKPESAIRAKHRAEALIKAEEAKERGEELPKPAPKMLKSPIALMGMEITDEMFLTKVAKIANALHETHKHIFHAIHALDSIVKEPDIAVDPRNLRILADNLKRFQERVLEEMPKSLCPACKGLDELSPECSACHGNAWVGKGVYERMPIALKDEEDPCVVQAGNIYKMAEFFQSRNPDVDTALQQRLEDVT